MVFRVGVGKSDFDDLRKSENYYVDKTDIMYELVEEKDNKVTLFTRPRRFGKTLMMSMLSNFFSIRKDSREEKFLKMRLWNFILSEAGKGKENECSRLQP